MKSVAKLGLRCWAFAVSARNSQSSLRRRKMSEFPSTYQELCIEKAEELREWWEPKFGDWALLPGKEPCIIMSSSRSALAQETWIVQTKDHRAHFFASALIPLPTQRQLQEWLEERGYGLYHLGDERFYPEFDGRDWNPEEPYQALAQGKEPGDYVKGIGPDPETALLRCLLAVMEHTVPTQGEKEEDELSAVS